MPHPDADQHKPHAAAANDAAWTLLEKTSLEANDVSELVTLAATALHHWKAIGTENQVAHAYLLFGWAMSRAGAGDLGLFAAERAFQHLGQPESADWEQAFANAAMAAAHHARGDGDAFRKFHATARAFGDQLAGPDKKYFQAAFNTLPPLD